MQLDVCRLEEGGLQVPDVIRVEVGSRLRCGIRVDKE